MSSFAHKRTTKRVSDVKRKARSELKDGWEPHQIVKHGLVDLNIDKCKDDILRVSSSEISVKEFIERFEKPGIPVILTGETDCWDSNTKWTIPKLYRKYRNQKFKCGQDDEGYSVKMKMKYYIDYMLSTTDDSPLYIFDSSFGEHKKASKLLNDYKVPEFFADDLFRYATEKRRPPYRWFVMGPPRSGTAIHVDPLGTSAWNALISGHKKWCLIHPSAPKALVKPRRDESGLHPDEAVTWFSTVYNRVRSSTWYPEFPVIHAVQNPGEVMFVPSGWWHVVMNLDNTVAITQNFCSISNLHNVWPKTVKGRPRFAKHWVRALQKERPEIMHLIAKISGTSDWNNVADNASSDSSSSSSSSDDSDSSDSDSGTEVGRSSVAVPSRKRRLSLLVEQFNLADNRAHTSHAKKHENESCPSKMRRSP